jgi:5-amino-6-(D-ribitylamino)uracil---L-tyrosine 4-hydroxyphenyl transferase
MQLNLDYLLKKVDPIVADALDRTLSGKDISVEHAVELLNCNGIEMNLVVLVADELRRQAVGDTVTYVINRNINFSNVCIKRCGFCAFSRDYRTDEGYFLPVEEIVRRAKEAWRLGATEICIQAGLPPKLDGHFYIDICNSIKKELPDIHIHAFSPEEVLYGSVRSEIPVEEYLKMLKDAGVGSLPGTAAEILDQNIRDIISPGRITAEDWIRIVKIAHSINIPTTSTIMYGHIENSVHQANHLALIRNIQSQTHGFTEFVPLSFVHTEAPIYNNNKIPHIRAGATGNEIIKVHAVSRIMLNNHIKNLQVSWVKEGMRLSQILLAAGANDLGGTLINESISNAAGSQYGQMVKPKDLRSIIRSSSRVPAQRSTTYQLLKVYPRETEHESDLDKADPAQFGSYSELIKLDEFRYRRVVKKEC